VVAGGDDQREKSTKKLKAKSPLGIGKKATTTTSPAPRKAKPSVNGIAKQKISKKVPLGIGKKAGAVNAVTPSDGDAAKVYSKKSEKAKKKMEMVPEVEATSAKETAAGGDWEVWEGEEGEGDEGEEEGEEVDDLAELDDIFAVSVHSAPCTLLCAQSTFCTQQPPPPPPTPTPPPPPPPRLQDAKTKQTAAKEQAAVAALKEKRVIATDDFGFGRGANKEKGRRTTEDGLVVYDNVELRIGEGGGETDQCPFDCQCCF
jgi:hypothetical protein